MWSKSGPRVMANKTSGALNLPGLQRSVTRLNQKIGTNENNRRACLSQVEQTASPKTTVSNLGKRKRGTSCADEEEEESPARKKMATDQAVIAALAWLEKKFDAITESVNDCAKKDDLTAIEISIRDKVRDNERLSLIHI